MISSRKFLTIIAFLFCASSVYADKGRADTAIVHFLERSYNLKFSTNNKVALLACGQEKYDDLFRAISQARKSIHMEYFNFRNDSISQVLFSLLKQKAAAGVEVRIIFDGWGNVSNNRPLRRAHCDSLAAAGIELCEFDPMRFPWINHAIHRDHRKLAIIDGLLAYIGGMNVADYYIDGKPELGEWRDMHFRVEGDAVAGLQGVFIDFWNEITAQDVRGVQYYPGEKSAAEHFDGLLPDTSATTGRKKIGVVNRDPDTSPRIIYQTFVKCIDEARTQIQIVNPYFTLMPKVKQALRRAARRGVDVQIMISEKCDVPITPRIVEHNVNSLMKSGASIYIYQGGFHHSKIMMVDSIFSFVGSANLNSRSMSFDYECNLLIADSTTTAELQSVFEKDKRERCYQLTPEIRRKMPVWKRFKGWFFQMFIPFVGRETNDKSPFKA